MKHLTGSKGGAGGQSVPRPRCQECHGALAVVGVADRLPPSGMHASAVQGSIMGTNRMDNSYVVLSKKNRSKGLGIPPRPLSAGSPHIEPSQPTRPIEGSYIMLPPPTASIYKTSSSEGDGAQLLPSSVNSSSSSPGNNSGFFSSVTVLKRAFEIATSQTQVEQPLCLECMRVLSAKMDFEIEDIKSDIKAYEACLQHLEQESYSILSETDFQEEKQKIEEEEKKLKADIEEAEKQYSEVSSEMKALETKSKRFEELEERYWQEFNSFQFQLTSHQEERDAISAKIEDYQAHLEMLKHTNVLNDAFYIAQYGVCGTINNLRLGHSHEVGILIAKCKAKTFIHYIQCFSYSLVEADFEYSYLIQIYVTLILGYRIKIHAVGSYTRITDINNRTHKLFGPANVLFSTRYDEAMTWFLTCLQEFVEFAVSLDKENNVPPDKSLKLPYKIDGDKVGGCRVVLGDFNTRENSTKALKNILCNLKWVLYWFIGTANFALSSG
ncbi:Beclin-1-like protein [Dichanthelium oligosanthes]|uniref:Beclin-1-like protein n=1 Tax=Dichanthelium oligosanthes TaxID=888268 RepID=A0A1E5WEW5_9POAL|nr:Beclin-1-like protein [Dichanthelium oligosanthes]